MIIESKYLRVYDNILKPEICQKIIEEFEKDDRKYPGKTGAGYRPDLKCSTDLVISKEGPWKQLDKDVYQAVKVGLQKYSDDVPSFAYVTEFSDMIDTSYQIQRYLPNNKDSFNWHSDCTSYESCNRILAAIIYLNDVEEGGETEFKFFEETMSVTPKIGRLVWFPPNFMFPHRGKIPISNAKYIITTFIIYNA
jgi:hypothetical protein